MLVTDFYIQKVANIKILEPKYKNCHHHRVTNIIVATEIFKASYKIRYLLVPITAGLEGDMCTEGKKMYILRKGFRCTICLLFGECLCHFVVLFRGYSYFIFHPAYTLLEYTLFNKNQKISLKPHYNGKSSISLIFR